MNFKYHHLGIPTAEKKPGETYLEQFKMYVSGFEESEFGVEWLRFDPGCQLPELVQTVPHPAFEVDNLEEAIKGRKILIAPNSPSPGVRVAFIEENGAPVEFLQLDNQA